MAQLKHGKTSGPIAAIPKDVMDSEDYRSLSFSAKALLFEFARQYTLKNNGKLCATFSQLKPRGWRSEDTLRRGIKELLSRNLIMLTKRGMYGNGKREPNFYAFTFQKIDRVEGFEMDVSPTRTPPRKFTLDVRGINYKRAA